MLQNHQVFCNKRDHQNQYISAICTKKECDSQSAVCSKCLLASHKYCEDRIIFLEELPQKLNKMENECDLINQIIENLIQQLTKFKNQYQLRLKSIREYKEIPNMTNLNNIGSFLRSTNIDLDKVLIGNELSSQQFESYLNPNKTKELTDQQRLEAKELRKIGDIHYDADRYQQAIEYYDKVLMINPFSDVYWNDKGLALYGLKKYQDAIECFDQALKINPNNDNSWSHKGQALEYLNKHQESIECFDKLIILKPTALGYYYKSFPLAQLYHLKEAEACLIKAYELDSNDNDIIERLIAIQDKLKK